MNKNKIAMCVIIAVAGILILAVLAAISSTNQALAQKKMCALTLNVSPDTKGASSYNVNGRLTCGGSGVGGATITFTNVFYGPQPGSGTITGPKEALTKSDGTFSSTCSNGCSLVWGEPKVLAHYAGDSDHSPATSNVFKFVYHQG